MSAIWSKMYIGIHVEHPLFFWTLFLPLPFTRKYKLAESTMYKELEICLQNQLLTIWFSKLISVHGKNIYFPLKLKKVFLQWFQGQMRVGRKMVWDFRFSK